EKMRGLLDQGGRAADEAERRPIVNERCQIVRADPTARPSPVFASEVARDCLTQLDQTISSQRAELSFIGELTRRPCAIQQTDCAMLDVERVSEHRPQWSDAGAARDKHKSLFLRVRGKRKAANGPLYVHQRSGSEVKMGSGDALGVDADEELEPPVVLCVL